MTVIKIIGAVLFVSVLLFFNVKSVISLINSIKDIKSKKKEDTSD